MGVRQLQYPLKIFRSDWLTRYRGPSRANSLNPSVPERSVTSGKIRTLDEAQSGEGEGGWRRKIQPASLTRRRSRSI
jgi:hypothetical protein